MTGRLVVVAALAIAVGVAWGWWWLRRRHDHHRGADGLPPLPDDLQEDLARAHTGTSGWVVMTTPVCAACASVRNLLGQHRPDEPVVTVDVTRRPAIAEIYDVISAPTTLRVTTDGAVVERLVGVAAVASWIDQPSPEHR